jgi:hypothetical protein
MVVALGKNGAKHRAARKIEDDREQAGQYVMKRSTE